MKEQEPKLRTYTTSYPYYNIVSKNPLDKKDFIIINNLYSKFLIAKILSGVEVTLPSSFGTLGIFGKKRKATFDEDGNISGLPIDWLKTGLLWKRNPEAKKERKKIYHLNAHTGGVTYKFWWSKLKSLLVNKTAYSLVMSRDNKRALPPLLREGKEYFTKS